MNDLEVGKLVRTLVEFEGVQVDAIHMQESLWVCQKYTRILTACQSAILARMVGDRYDSSDLKSQSKYPKGYEELSNMYTDMISVYIYAFTLDLQGLQDTVSNSPHK